VTSDPLKKLLDRYEELTSPSSEDVIAYALLRIANSISHIPGSADGHSDALDELCDKVKECETQLGNITSALDNIRRVITPH
jgi:hypothetical protein